SLRKIEGERSHPYGRSSVCYPHGQTSLTSRLPSSK
ncbi:hypothetical protein SOVF_182390, partial [Spinacia oleracea]